jgi:hypothetical protein
MLSAAREATIGAALRRSVTGGACRIMTAKRSARQQRAKE